MDDLPRFTYHPDPIGTGAITRSAAECPACRRTRGYAYSHTPYALGEHEDICPWCIADGTAHTKFDATFVAESPLENAGVPQRVVAEVTQRTPGFECWQQERWLACCGDACAFLGDAPADEIRSLDADGFERLEPAAPFEFGEAPEFLSGYEPGGSPSFYKFVCRHCAGVRYGWDCD